MDQLSLAPPFCIPALPSIGMHCLIIVSVKLLLPESFVVILCPLTRPRVMCWPSHLIKWQLGHLLKCCCSGKEIPCLRFPDCPRGVSSDRTTCVPLGLRFCESFLKFPSIRTFGHNFLIKNPVKVKLLVFGKTDHPPPYYSSFFSASSCHAMAVRKTALVDLGNP